MQDSYGREISYMRISITDRCNLRCRYCMPDGIRTIPMAELLTYEEIVRVAAAAAELRISRIKVTGGEPLVRKGATSLIRMLKGVPGITEVTMTTNGILLEKEMPVLLDAGLDAVNISLDSLQAERYKQITGKDELSAVLRGIDAAVESGLRVKINAVLQKDVNEDEWEDLIDLAKDRLLDVRFIEMMPIGYGKHFSCVSNTWLRERMKKKWPDLWEDTSRHGNGPAVYVHIPGYKGSVGFISAMHGKFCGSCNRIRMSSTGRLKPCLCYGASVDLREILRDGKPEEEQQRLKAAIEEAIRTKPEAHCFEKPEEITEHHRMSGIGG